MSTSTVALHKAKAQHPLCNDLQPKATATFPDPLDTTSELGRLLQRDCAPGGNKRRTLYLPNPD